MTQENIKLKLTIGLEIHAELKTKTKMFCACKNDTDEKRPNVNICPICMGHPGTLPVINKEAVKSILKIGVAVEGTLAKASEFDRKNYFYPDIPKGYQISQYKYPLVSGGILDGVALTRVHLEEDTAKSSHDTGDYSLVDFNRAGVPLMELVTEPVIHSSAEAVKFGQELQKLLQYIGVADANMEKGEMRLEANVSVSKTDKFGTKVEIKNINSFRSAERAIEYEIKRQTELLKSGEKVIQETRGWSDDKQITFSQRSKEDPHDYRYFPEPDLPKLAISEIPEFGIEELKKELPELPSQKRERLKRVFGLKDEDVEFYINYPKVSDFFEKVVAQIKEAKTETIQTASNYITTDLVSLSKAAGQEDVFGRLTPATFAELMLMVNSGQVSSRGAKDTLKIVFESGGEPSKIAAEKGLVQKSDTAELKTIVQKVIANNSNVAIEYKNGKASALQFLIGQGMKATKGSANPQVLKEVFEELLS